MKTIPVIMAGGKGERFWPRSRRNLPKQFLPLLGESTMLQLTVQRMQGLASIEDIYIVAGEEYRHLITQQVPALPPRNIIIEPIGRNTAPCIGLAAATLKQLYGNEAILLVVPADHMILDQSSYLSTMGTAAAICSRKPDSLVTVGIKPTEPETAYGYIKLGRPAEELTGHTIYNVSSFVEKPDLITAQKYLNSGEYLWNSGSFVGTISSILDNIKLHLPELYQILTEISARYENGDYKQILAQLFPQAPAISFDYGIMEKAAKVMVIPGDFGWDDVGSWTSLERLTPAAAATDNVAQGNVLSLESSGCIIQAEKTDKLIALLGVDNLIVVDTKDVTLICAKDRAQDIKKILDNLKHTQQERYI